jgi:hypothetical protein
MQQESNQPAGNWDGLAHGIDEVIIGLRRLSLCAHTCFVFSPIVLPLLSDDIRGSEYFGTPRPARMQWERVHGSPACFQDLDARVHDVRGQLITIVSRTSERGAALPGRKLGQVRLFSRSRRFKAEMISGTQMTLRDNSVA